jgi:hypothetical protein
MPITVTCPECHYHFLVSDEFAGQQGRCPECSALMIVPGESEPVTDVHVEEQPDPYYTHRHREREEFPDRPRRSQFDRADHEEELRRDYRDPDHDRPKFDAEARRRAWNRVYKGLGSIQIAVILYFFGQILQTGFVLARGLEQANPNALDSGDIAVGLGGAFIMLLAALFWMWGRLCMIKVPYVPARGWAKAGFYLVIASLVSFMGFCCLFVMAVGAMGGGPNGGAVALLMLAVLMMLFSGLLILGAEFSGLMALSKIGTGLHNPSAASWARVSLILMFAVISLLFFAACGLSVYSAQQKQKQQAQAGNQAGNGNPGANPNPPFGKQRGKAGNPPAKAEKKDDKKDQPQAGPNGNANGQAQPQPGQPQGQPQQPNPFEDDGLDDTTRFIFQMSMVGLILLYLVHYSISLQKGRRVIRGEMEALAGEHGHDSQRHDHHY